MILYSTIQECQEAGTQWCKCTIWGFLCIKKNIKVEYSEHVFCIHIINNNNNYYQNKLKTNKFMTTKWLGSVVLRTKTIKHQIINYSYDKSFPSGNVIYCWFCYILYC